MISDERLNEILGALCTDSLHDYEQVFDGIKNGEIGDMAKELLAMRNATIPEEFLKATQNASGMFELSEDCMCQLMNMLCSKPTDSTT